MLKRLAAAALLLLGTGPALADRAAEMTTQYLYTGALQAGLDRLEPQVKLGDPEARFGFGLLQFVQAIEGLAQGLYRHGLAAEGPGAPLLLPVPPNPDPVPLDYETLRLLLDDFVSELDAARDVLLLAGAGGDFVVPLDPFQFRLDINEDGDVTEAESIGGIVAHLFGGETASMPAEPLPPGAEVVETIIGFDRADAIWLAGYANVLAMQADFLLAHDFSELVNSSFHRLFPKAGLPMQGLDGRGLNSGMLDAPSENAVADAIAAIHTISWPVIEPDRLRGVLGRLEAITALSRQNWAAILAETDDNLELVPSPRQTPLIPEAVVTDATVTAWMATLDTVDEILAGRLLLPHWRFEQGFDLRAYFETATRTDLVMLITGYGALPFLKQGPIAGPESFAAANAVFGENWLGYAFWFN